MSASYSTSPKAVGLKQFFKLEGTDSEATGALLGHLNLTVHVHLCLSGVYIRLPHSIVRCIPLLQSEKTQSIPKAVKSPPNIAWRTLCSTPILNFSHADHIDPQLSLFKLKTFMSNNLVPITLILHITASANIWLCEDSIIVNY